MKIVIKNMVCGRCRLVVKQILNELDITFSTIDLGIVILDRPCSDGQLKGLKFALSEVGLELLDDSKSQQVEKIKVTCLEYLNEKLFLQNIRLSDYVAKRLHKNYSHLSRLFSSINSHSIEKYYLNLRIEKVKECISYEGFSFSEIAYELGFSSVAHLSKQFKSNTGLTLSEFRKNNQHRESNHNIKIV